MGQSERIQLLRELLSTPSHEHWEAIWQAVDEWPKYKSLSVEWDYFAQHIQAWPAHFLMLPQDQHDAWGKTSSDHPLFPFVRGMRIPPPQTPEEYHMLHKGPRAAQLTHLEIADRIFDVSEIRKLFHKDLTPLESLVFRRGALHDKALEALLKAPPLQSLTRLSLPHNEIKAQDCHTIATLVSPTLQYLNLDSNPLRAKGLFQLLASPRLAALRELSANWCHLANQRLAPRTPAPKALRKLSLAYNRLGVHALSRLLQRDAMSQLGHLDISGNQLDPGAISELGALLPPSLESLDLRCTDLGSKGARALVEHLQTPHLTSLDISFNGLQTQTLSAIEAQLPETNVTCEPIQSASHPETATDQRFSIRTASQFGGRGGRYDNGDAIAIAPEHQLYILADGTGGYNFSNIASQLLVHALSQELDLSQKPATAIEPTGEHDYFFADLCQRLATIAPTFRERESHLYHRVLCTNHFLYTSKRNPSNPHSRPLSMETTFAAFVLSHNRALVTNIGRARVYRWRNGACRRLTEDHYWTNEYLDDRDPTPDEIESYKHPSLSGKYVGVEHPLTLEVRSFDVAVGDVYLLCSTGVTRYLGQKRIDELMQEHLLQPKRRLWRHPNPLQRACDRLIRATRGPENGSTSALLLAIDEEVA